MAEQLQCTCGHYESEQSKLGNRPCIHGLGTTRGCGCLVFMDVRSDVEIRTSRIDIEFVDRRVKGQPTTEWTVDRRNNPETRLGIINLHLPHRNMTFLPVQLTSLVTVISVEEMEVIAIGMRQIQEYGAPTFPRTIRG